MSRLRSLAGRAVGWMFESLGGPPPGPAGAQGDDGAPVAVVLLLGADADVTAATAAGLAAAAPRAGRRVLLVMDQPHFGVARRAGVAVDHVLSREAWAERGHVEAWEEYLRAELRRLRRDFATRTVVTLPPNGSVGLDDGTLDALLRPAGSDPSGGWRRRARAAVVRLERRVDHPSRRGTPASARSRAPAGGASGRPPVSRPDSRSDSRPGTSPSGTGGEK